MLQMIILTRTSVPLHRAFLINRPNEPEFTTELGLPNEELDPFSEDENEVLHNQPQNEDDEEEAWPVSPITTIPPYTQNFEESYF